MSFKHKKLLCPCCGKMRSDKAQKVLLDIESECNLNQVKAWWGYEGWSIKAAMENSLQWACHICLESSVAIKGKPWLQTWCDHSPYFAFFDVEVKCGDCDNKFIFSAHEQQFWYEKLSFWVQSRPKQCKNCRKRRREIKQTNKTLQEFLKNYDSNNPLELAELAKLYFEINNIKKESIFLRRAVNVAKKNKKEKKLEAFLQNNNLKLQD